MKIINLTYDLFIAALILGSGYYMLLHFKGRFDQTEKQKIERQKRVKKHGGIIKFFIVITFIIGGYFLLIFITNFLAYLT